MSRSWKLDSRDPYGLSTIFWVKYSKVFHMNDVVWIFINYECVLSWCRQETRQYFTGLSQEPGVILQFVYALNTETFITCRLPPVPSIIRQVRFQVLTAASMNISVFWHVVPCSMVEIDRRFKGAHCLWNVAQFLPDYTTQHFRRQSSS
jgi:hypothetical protein